MQVSIYKIQNYDNYPKFPSFKMKMTELKGIDRFVAKSNKINPQPLKTLEDFQNYCKKLVDKIAKTDFGGRQQETQVQRKAMIDEWFNYVTKENDAYTGAMQYMILRAITSDLKPNEDNLPVVLNKGVLANTVSEVQKTLEEKPDTQFNFEKTYRNNLQKSMLQKETALDENLNGWIIIPSKEHDPENFEANVDKLKMLSHNNWCTKSFNAEPYLADGDFHVYMEKGKPKLGVRFVGDEIQEIQGELNNSRIPVKYGDIAQDHIKDYGLKENAKREIKNLEKVKEQIKEFKAKFENGIENASTQEILENFGIKCKKDSDGLLIISNYGNGKYEFRLSDLEIDETKLFKEIKIIEGYAYFENSQVQSLGNLQSIGRNANFNNSQVQDLGKLQTIGGDAWFTDSQVKDLGNLRTIGRNAYFSNSQVQSLGNLQSIGRNAYFNNSQVRDLGELQSIGGDADFSDSPIQSLGELQSIGGSVYFSNSQVQDLGNLQTIGGDADFRYSQVQSLGNLQSIGRNAYFSNSQVKDLGKLQSIGKDADFGNSQIQSLGDLQSIGRTAWFSNSQIKDLGNLQSIGGDADFGNSQVKDLGKLQTIDGKADFRNSQVKDLGNLQSIGRWADFENSQVKDLGKLESIGGGAYIENCPLSEKDFENIEVGGEIVK